MKTKTLEVGWQLSRQLSRSVFVGQLKCRVRLRTALSLRAFMLTDMLLAGACCSTSKRMMIASAASLLLYAGQAGHEPHSESQLQAASP